MAKPNLCEQLTEIFKGYYQYHPKVLEVSESYHFHHTLQNENKTITEYANKLKRLGLLSGISVHTQSEPWEVKGAVTSQAARKKLLPGD